MDDGSGLIPLHISKQKRFMTEYILYNIIRGELVSGEGEGEELWIDALPYLMISLYMYVHAVAKSLQMRKYDTAYYWF